MKIAIFIWAALTIVSCSPIEPKELKPTEEVDTSYFFTNKQIINQMEEYPTTSQCKCPNCDEYFDGHECENCHYTEER